MKVGFHFNADYKPFDGSYGFPINKQVFIELLNNRALNINSKMFQGDLLLHMHSYEVTEVFENGQKSVFVPEKFARISESWYNPEGHIWKRFTEENFEKAIQGNIHVLCFESIDLAMAEYLHTQLSQYEYYYGAMEVDESNGVHWGLYGQSLIPFGRIINKKLSLFFDEPEGEKDTGLQSDLQKLPFDEIDFECLNWKYTIFDKYANFEQARRIAEWKKNAGALLAFIGDDVVSRLSDTAPELVDKLWTALKTFEQAETNEQLAQVTASCRRI